MAEETQYIVTEEVQGKFGDWQYAAERTGELPLSDALHRCQIEANYWQTPHSVRVSIGGRPGNVRYTLHPMKGV